MTRGTARFAPATAIAAFVAIGLVDSSHGVLWPTLRADVGLPLVALAALTTALGVGYGVSSAMSGRLSAHWSPPRLLRYAWMGGALGLAICAVSPVAAVLILGVVVLGGAGGLIDAGTQSQAARHGGLRLQGAIHAAYGAGAAAGPLLIGAMLVAGVGWRMVYAALALVAVAMLGGLVLWPHRWWAPGDAGRSTEGAPAPARLRVLDELPALAGFSAVVALEAGSYSWLFTFLREGRDLSIGLSSVIATTYGVAYTLPRLLLVAAGHRVTPGSVLRAGLVATCVGFGVATTGTTAALVAALVIAGIGVGGLYPCLMATTASRVADRLLDVAVGHQVAAATVGAALGSSLPGLAFERFGVSAYPEIMLGLAAVTAVVCARLAR